MATSGSKDFSLDRNGIIRNAIYLMGGKMSRAVSPQDEFDVVANQLNMMLKHWQAEGIGIWMWRNVNIYFADATATYSLGPAGKYAYSGNAVKTETSAAASSGATSIVVDSATGIDGTYPIAVELDDGTLQWTTVDGSPAGTTITLSDALDDDVSEDAHVYCYSAVADRPLELDNLRRVSSDGSELPINPISRDDYMATVNKDSAGSPNQAYYDPQLTNGEITFWPVPNNVQEYCKADALIEFDDFDASTDDGEFPTQFYLAIVWNLATMILPMYRPREDDGGIFNRMSAYVTDRAVEFKDAIERFDSEEATIQFVFSNR